MINPFQYFMNLKPAVKIVVISCITLLALAFMFFAYQSGVFDLVVKSVFGIEAKK
jgi:hypothetical protein